MRHAQTLSTVTFLLALALAVCAARGQEGHVLDLLDGQPFDTVTVRDGSRDVQLRAFPLEFPDGKIPESPRLDARLRMRLLDYPDEEYTVQWKYVKGIERFPQRLLRGAQDLVRQGQLNDAFAVFAHLYQHYPQTPGLDQAYIQYLGADVSETFRQGQLDDALMVLAELQRRNPQQSGLDRALGRVADQVLEKMFADRQYRRIDQWMEQYGARFGEAVQPALARWRKRLEERAQELHRQALELRRQGQPGRALRVASEALACWPDVPKLEELVAELAREHPVIYVGVRHPSPAAPADSNGSWAAQRLQWLVQRPLVELADFTNEGGLYHCRLGKAQMTTDRRQLTLELDETDVDDGASYQVSRFVLEQVRGAGPDRVETLRHSVAAVWPEGPAQVHVDLRWPMLEGLALLRLPFPLANPYQRVSEPSSGGWAEAGSVFAALQAPAEAPREITERAVGSGFDALDLLRTSQVDVIDRLWPFERASLEAEPGLAVGTYRTPSLHWLVINPRQPFLQRPEFRRALVYGIDRTAILRDVFLGGMQVDGCQVLSGPCPAGLTPEDALGYGYNRDIEPRPYDPLVARTLIQLSIANLSDAKEASRPATPQLILACPNDEAIQNACRLVRTSLQRVGVQCELRILEPGQQRPPDDDWDLLYVDLQIREPLSDLCRLFGPGGLVQRPGPYVSLAIQQVSRAGNWTQARQSLQQLHRWAHDDATIIPLWQLVDAFAFRTAVTGIGDRLMSLYQNVTEWRLLPGSVARNATSPQEANRS